MGYSGITPDHPGDVAAPHSPDGVPFNGTGPQFYTWLVASQYSHSHAGANLKGVNDVTCRPALVTCPVTLIDTCEDAFATWSYYAPQLKLAGLFLFTLNHNIPDPPREWAAIAGDIRSTAAFLAYYVNKYWPRPVEHTRVSYGLATLAGLDRPGRRSSLCRQAQRRVVATAACRIYLPR